MTYSVKDFQYTPFYITEDTKKRLGVIVNKNPFLFYPKNMFRERKGLMSFIFGDERERTALPIF